MDKYSLIELVKFLIAVAVFYLIFRWDDGHKYGRLPSLCISAFIAFMVWVALLGGH